VNKPGLKHVNVIAVILMIKKKIGCLNVAHKMVQWFPLKLMLKNTLTISENLIHKLLVPKRYIHHAIHTLYNLMQLVTTIIRTRGGHLLLINPFICKRKLQ
jgi:hypothetical protein